MGQSQSLPTATTRWVSLKEKMESTIFGQHLATGEVYFRFYSHFKAEAPEKALVIICRGSLGTGKTYFCQLIANEIYSKGFDNPWCKLFIGPRDFPDPSKASVYQDVIRKTVEETVKQYSRSLFVFDEVDKAPIGMLDVLAPYITENAIVNKVDYRFSTFIFISNFGGTNESSSSMTVINDIVLSHLESKRKRDELMLIQFQEALQEIALKEPGGLKDSKIIKNKLIDYHLPFLPLEKEHITKCLKIQYNVKETELINKVLEILTFEPERNPIFAADGAKNVEVQLEYARLLLKQ